MNFKEVFKKCNDGDFVKDSDNCKWKVNEGDLTNGIVHITDFYTLKELFDLDFKKVYDVDWSKVEVDAKILVSNDDIKWYRRYFAKYENGKVCTFVDGATSFSTDGYCISWNYAKLYKEDGEEEENGN